MEGNRTSLWSVQKIFSKPQGEQWSKCPKTTGCKTCQNIVMDWKFTSQRNSWFRLGIRTIQFLSATRCRFASCSKKTNKHENLCYSQLSGVREIVWGLPSDTFLDSSYWPNRIKHQTYKKKMVEQQEVLNDTKRSWDKLPVPLHNLAPTGQPIGHRLLSCCFRRPSWRCSLDHWGSRLHTGVLAWGLLQIQI